MASIYGPVSATGWQLRLDYTVSQDAANNRSALALTLYIYDGTGESYNQAANSCRYVLQGKTVYQPYRYESKGWYKLGSGSVTVNHRSDGSGSAALSAAWYSGFTSQWTPASLSVAQTVALPVIPRASGLQAGSMTLGQTGSITVQRADAGFTHKIDYQIGSTHGAVCGKTGETRVTWMPPLSLAEKITDAVAGDCVLTATTYSGSSVVGTSSCPIKLYVPEEVKPTASLAAQVVNDNAVIAGWGVCVRGYSRLAYQVTAAGARGSSIRSCRVQFAGQTAEDFTGQTGTIQQAGTLIPEARVTDSRGRWATAQGGAVEVLPYANPTLTARLLGRCGADGTLRDDGDCVRVLCTGACSPVGGHNTVTVRYRLRPVGGSYSGYTALENGQEQIIEGVLKTASYELELSAVDALGSVRAVEYAIPTAAVAVHLAQGGTAVGVGKYAEHDKAVDIAPDWDVWFRGKRLLDAVWPVGSIYLSASEISPETLFGGTWEQVKDRFLLAAGDVYEPGETGGEAQHTLTKAEMPAHTHGYDFTGQSDVTGVTAIRLYDADGRRNEYQGASASAGGGGRPQQYAAVPGRVCLAQDGVRRKDERYGIKLSNDTVRFLRTGGSPLAAGSESGGLFLGRGRRIREKDPGSPDGLSAPGGHDPGRRGGQQDLGQPGRSIGTGSSGRPGEGVYAIPGDPGRKAQLGGAGGQPARRLYLPLYGTHGGAAAADGGARALCL